MLTYEERRRRAMSGGRQRGDEKVMVTVADWMEFLKENTSSGGTCWADSIMLDHMWDVFCACWVGITACVIIGKE